MYPRKSWLETYSIIHLGFTRKEGYITVLPAILVLPPTGEKEILGIKSSLVKHKIIKDIKTIWAVMPTELGSFIMITRSTSGSEN